MTCPYCGQSLTVTEIFETITIDESSTKETNYIQQPRREYYCTNFACGYRYPQQGEFRKPGSTWISNR